MERLTNEELAAFARLAKNPDFRSLEGWLSRSLSKELSEVSIEAAEHKLRWWQGKFQIVEAISGKVAEALDVVTTRSRG